MTGINRIRDALTAVEPLKGHVWHFTALSKTPPYAIWAEDGQGSGMYADGRMTNQAISGTVDLFTADLDDQDIPNAIQAALNTCGCAWRLNSVQYEDDTHLKHLEWAWEVEGVDDG